jgi:RNA polymerase sigma factor (sigma-70 family)
VDLQQLIDQLRKGEKSAGPILVSVVAPMFMGYVEAIASDLSLPDRERAVESAIERAVDKIDRYDPMRGSFSAWARTFVRHAVADERRRGLEGAPDAVIDNLAEPSPSDDSSTDSEVVTQLSEALASLGPTDQLILQLRYIEQLSHAQIASALGVSDAASRQRTARAIARLRGAAQGAPALANYTKRDAR